MSTNYRTQPDTIRETLALVILSLAVGVFVVRGCALEYDPLPGNAIEATQ